MRGLLLAALAVPLACGAARASGPAPTPQYRTASETAAVRASGEIGGPTITDPDFRVLIMRRDTVGEAELHAAETDIFFVDEGKAIIVVGGEMVGARDTAPGEIRGSSIRGGKDHVLEPGIVLTIPRGTPHWIREISPGFRYTVVKTPAR